ncbi:MAG: CAP domain-containing protein [Treponema sp.]|nr:CAP domain-containing protein [Treponema sp.]
MKKVVGLGLLLAALLFASCSHSSSSSSDGGGNTYSGGGTTGTDQGTGTGGSSSSSGTTSAVTPTEMEAAVLTEMNFARTNPQGYVNARLVPQRTNPTVNLSGTSTYQSALEECISQMNAMTPIGSLSLGAGLYKAAREWVVTQGAGTTTGHDPNLGSRISKYCNWTSRGENLAYGYSTAEAIVIALLVDDGVGDRGHRKNILETDNHGPYTHAGVSIGSHARYNIMCCIDYAGGYSDK